MGVPGQLSARGYERLLVDGRRILEEGRAEASAAVGQVLAQTYWELGTRVLSEELAERAGYGVGIVQEPCMS